MPMVAQKPPYTLFVVDDTEPMNPRQGGGNFGKMICFSKRHSLGDDHDYKEPNNFLADLCNDLIPGNEIIDMIKENKFDNLLFERDEEDEETYHLKYYCDIFKKWYIENTFDITDFAMDAMVADAALPLIKDSDLLEILDDHIVILPVYLYDHSGLSVNTVGFSCRWDSGQVGWIYAKYDDLYRTIGRLDIEKAENLLKAEVEEYDHYLTGQCYGFKLYEGDSEINSCWGFLGDMADVSKYIKEHLPSECKDITDLLEYHSEVDEDEYLEQALETEDEEEMEM
jgi:hypothetical protein